MKQIIRNADLLQDSITDGYLMVLFSLYLYYNAEGYAHIGTDKYCFFRNLTVLYLTVTVLICFIKRMAYGKNQVLRISMTDRCVCAYGICTAISFLFCIDYQTGLFGAEEWYMGFLMQLAFVCLYFAISRTWRWKEYAFPVICVCSGGVFLLGILHRLGIDPLGLYTGLSEEKMLSVLSTIGQATWYSSFVCTIFPIGVYLFWNAQKWKMRMFAVCYLILAFGTIVTQNSDSAFAALSVVLLALLFTAFESREKWKRFLELLLLMCGTFAGMGLLQRLFSDRAVRPGTISVMLTQSRYIWGILAALVVVRFLYRGEGTGWNMKVVKRVRAITFITLIVLFAGVLSLIVLNSTGWLAKWMDSPIYKEYLYFDESWGNNRGIIWMVSLQMYDKFTVFQKIFGIGPDCYGIYAYRMPEFADRLSLIFGSRQVRCAHNEVINTLLCYGIAGAMAYYSIFASAIRDYTKKRECAPQVYAVGLCMISYLAHNFFCYQQVVCTPFIFVLAGMAESVLRAVRERPFC